MQIKDLNANKGNVDLVLDIVEKGEVREFAKFGKPGRVCSCNCKDETGEVIMTLWNEQIDSVKQGDKVHLSNGWCSEFQGSLQVSGGKFGKIEVVGESGASESKTSKAIPHPAGEEDNPNEDKEEDFEVDEEKF